MYLILHLMDFKLSYTVKKKVVQNIQLLFLQKKLAYSFWRESSTTNFLMQLSTRFVSRNTTNGNTASLLFWYDSCMKLKGFKYRLWI